MFGNILVPQTKGVKIVDKLFLSGKEGATDEKFIKDNNITVIVNCTEELPNTFKPFYVVPLPAYVQSPFLEYYQLQVKENNSMAEQKRLFEQLFSIVQTIDKKINNENKTVLVHCTTGDQRGAATVAAYLYYKYHKTTGCSMDMVIDHIKKMKSSAFGYGYTFIFKKSLEEFIKYV